MKTVDLLITVFAVVLAVLVVSAVILISIGETPKHPDAVVGPCREYNDCPGGMVCSKGKCRKCISNDECYGNLVCKGGMCDVPDGMREFLFG